MRETAEPIVSRSTVRTFSQSRIGLLLSVRCGQLLAHCLCGCFRTCCVVSRLHRDRLTVSASLRWEPPPLRFRHFFLILVLLQCSLSPTPTLLALPRLLRVLFWHLHMGPMHRQLLVSRLGCLRLCLPRT
jgi:hypothetical protein